jgi:hypothetical protein
MRSVQDPVALASFARQCDAALTLSPPRPVAELETVRKRARGHACTGGEAGIRDGR